MIWREVGSKNYFELNDRLKRGRLSPPRLMSVAWDYRCMLGMYGDSKEETQIIANLLLSEVLRIGLKDTDQLVEGPVDWIARAEQAAKQTASPVMIDERKKMLGAREE